jgi:preprotein translocase subunit SecE
VKAISFLREVKSEAMKVSWPVPKDALMVSGVVCVVVFVFALLLLAVDTSIYHVIQFLLKV